jgi:acyl-CoA synthetase (AMP-forming)/AMP-acid ligase II
MHFAESLTIQSLRVPGKIAIKDDLRTTTYRELNARVDSLVSGLLSLGLNKGDLICQLQGNSIEHFELIFALGKGGMIRLPLNPRANPSEWVHIINSFEPRALVFDEVYAPTIIRLKPQFKGCSYYISTGVTGTPGAVSFEHLATSFPDSEPYIDIGEEDPYIIQATSGTTGIPKAALLSQIGTIKRTLIRAVDLGNSGRGVYLAVTSLANTASTFYALSQLYLGGTVILRNRFDPLDFLETIEREKVTNVSLVPVMGEKVLEVPDLSKYDLSSLEIFISYGAPLHSQTRRKLTERVTLNLVETYGMTETGPITNLMPQDQLRKENCVGQPTMHTKIQIVDSDYHPLPVGQDGEITVKTPYMFLGYLNNPVETAKVFRDGWFYTGDVGRVDEEGYLYIVGRRKNMIISGGYNIYEEEVERVLAEHPRVKEVAVIGVPDEKWGEAVKAIVALSPGAQVREEEIIEFCKESLAGYKKPKSVDFVTALPRLSSGKIAKQQLREKYWEGHEKKIA